LPNERDDVTKQLFVAAWTLTAMLQVPSAIAEDWTQKLPARSPSGRKGHAMAYDSAHGQVVLFGGAGADNAVLSDTWTWDGSNWTQRSPANSPPARDFHAMAYDSVHQQVVLFGGSTSSYYSLLSDTWVWDGSNWAQKSPANSPPARFNHAMAYDAAHGQVVLFGGCCRDPLSDTQDTWVWDGSNWAQKFPANNPGVRDTHAMAYDSSHQQVVLFSGQFNVSGQNFFVYSDTWVWDGSNWTQKFPANSPPGRRYLGMASEPARGLVLLFGGLVLASPGDLIGHPASDTWIWEGSNWFEQSPIQRPPARFSAALAYSATGDLVMFGGYPNTMGPNTPLSDTWIWNPFMLRPSTLNFAFNLSVVTSPQLVTLSFPGAASSLAWTALSSQANITVSPTSGTGNSTLTVTVSQGPSGTITVTPAPVTTFPKQILVNVATTPLAAPFGRFDTPVDNVTGVAGAIPITGWALDNIEVNRVDIFRESIPGESPGTLIFIGTATFVAGARPDVESQFTSFPFQFRAGWGYQMLTNVLPNSSGAGAPGNGTYKLHAIAFNKGGLQTELGTKTITVDNAHAAKPFGTIDTPAQGGTISGADSVNFGWALTPQPAMIPVDGSTITVVIDGVAVGHPTYNQLRPDIASVFPNYKNSGGAVGFFHLDTTMLANGVHTISWNVFDDQGRGEGLGSRYFNVLNTGASVTAVEDAIDESVGGVTLNGLPEPIAQDADGGYSVTMEEVGHLQLHLGAASGNMLLQGEPQPLPAGSTLKGGVFYWQPGPGFLGEYTMQFERPDGVRILVRVRIVPRGYSLSR
jgi:Galactose oxidase, central domain